MATTVNIGQGTAPDSYMRQDSATTNYGSALSVIVKSRATAINRRGIIRFDLSALPAGSTITSALLNMRLTSVFSTTSDRTLGAHRVDHGIPNYETDWVESEVTWNSYKSASAWGTAGGNFNVTATDSIVVGNDDIFYIWDVTSDCDALENRSWIIKDSVEESGSTEEKWFYSKEYTTDTSLRPYLKVTYEPAAVAYMRPMKYW